MFFFVNVCLLWDYVGFVFVNGLFGVAVASVVVLYFLFLTFLSFLLLFLDILGYCLCFFVLVSNVF